VTTGLATAILTLLVGSDILQVLASLWATRRKRGADTASELAKNALAQVTSLQERYGAMERKYDSLEEDIRKFREALYPHQRWDMLAHKEALKSDPNFPSPPELFI
jgi:hypothetical protein